MTTTTTCCEHNCTEKGFTNLDTCSCPCHTPTEPTDSLEMLIEKIQDKYRDKGDERFGLSKHNNTILQNIVDDFKEVIRNELTSQKERILAALPGETDSGEVGSYNVGFNDCLQEVKETIDKI